MEILYFEISTYLRHLVELTRDEYEKSSMIGESIRDAKHIAYCSCYVAHIVRQRSIHADKFETSVLVLQHFIN